jgi:Flp pilus assembly protein TadG
LRLRKKIRMKKARSTLWNLAFNEKGTELIELAFTLPLFFLMIVGIVDIGGAWGAKDQITGTARDGARVAVSTFNDMTNPQCGGGAVSCTAQAAVNEVVAAVTNAALPPCGMTSGGLAATGQPFTWSDSAVCPNGGTFTITVARAVPETDTSSGTNITVMTTQVTVNYPYSLPLSLGGGILFGLNPFGNYTMVNSMATMTNSN